MGTFQGKVYRFIIRLVAASNGYILSYLNFLCCVYSSFIHYVSCIILDPRYAELLLLGEFANANGINSLSNTVQGYKKLLLDIMESYTTFFYSATSEPGTGGGNQSVNLFVTIRVMGISK